MKKEGKEGRKDEMKDGGKREEGGVNLFEKAVCIVGSCYPIPIGISFSW